MKLLFAPDSFKGSLTSKRIIELLKESANRVFPGCETVGVPMADGGEGTLDTLVEHLHGRYEEVETVGPLGSPVYARYGITEGKKAIIEMAQASGLPLVPREALNPLKASSYGTGQLVAHAVEAGCREIYLTVGGSATNDGGMGAGEALGLRYLDKGGRELKGCGENLELVESIDTAKLIPELKDVKITILTDVKNKLLGEKGATYVYGPQKGGTAEQLDRLEQGMKHYFEVMCCAGGKNLEQMEGLGAAGGISLPFAAFMDARIDSGIETVVSLLSLQELLDGVDLVVTGEGRIDKQSVYGKVLSGIGHVCRERGIPAIAVAGCMGDGAEQILNHGIESMTAAVNAPMTLEEAVDRAEELLTEAADRMFRLVKVGMQIQKIPLC